LEIIVLKAMEKRPQDRYATAQELADDLERWLRHEPIQARRPTVVQRVRKWSRRHQAVVWAASLVIAIALALLAGSAGWVARDRAMQRAETERVVTAALAESASWQEKRRLPEALSAAHRARGLLAGRPADAALQRLVQARTNDLELLDKLENVRLEMRTALKDGHFDWEGAEALYAQTFRDVGLDVETLPTEEAGERIQETTIAAELAAVLDDWALLRWERKGIDDSSWKRLLQIARLADPDASRTRVRMMLEIRDRKAMQELAASEEVLRLSPMTLSVIGAVLLTNKESLGQAERFLRQAQRQHPNDFWINYDLFEYFTARKAPQWEEAVRFAAVMVALRPESPGAHLNLSYALGLKGQWDEAIAECHEAIRLNKDYAGAHVNLGNALSKKGQLDEAIAEYREAIRLKKDFTEAHNNLGNALREKGRLDEAVAAHREAIRLNKDNELAHNNLGMALHDKGKLDEAIAEYREAIRIKKDYAEFHICLGLALSAKGQLDEAIAEYREAIRIKKDYAEAHHNLGCALEQKGRLDEAIAEFREAIQIKKDSPLPHNSLGLALYRKGQLDEAIAEYRQAIRLNKDYAGAHVNLGNALSKKGQLDEAIAEFGEAIRIKPDFAKAHYNLGNALRHKGQLDEAIAAYHEVIRLNEDFAEAHCNLGDALERKGQFAEALPHRRRGHELGSKNPSWRYPSAQWVRHCERLVELDGKLPLILSGQKQPSDSAECLALAQLCQMPAKKRYAAALRFYSEAFTDQPKLAEDLNTQHRYQAACAAALAGCGQGKDADKLDDKERARLRQQALDWLRADLKAYRQVMDKSAGKAGPAIAQRMQHWLQDNDFGGVRGEAALLKLPEAERPAWQKLWQEVEALRQQTATKTKPPTAENQPNRKEESPRMD
jgi:tetratricopeptide (TPR) repeat protein